MTFAIIYAALLSFILTYNIPKAEQIRSNVHPIIRKHQ